MGRQRRWQGGRRRDRVMKSQIIWGRTNINYEERTVTSPLKPYRDDILLIRNLNTDVDINKCAELIQNYKQHC